MDSWADYVQWSGLDETALDRPLGATTPPEHSADPIARRQEASVVDSWADYVQWSGLDETKVNGPPVTATPHDRF